MLFIYSKWHYLKGRSWYKFHLQFVLLEFIALDTMKPDHCISSKLQEKNMHVCRLYDIHYLQNWLRKFKHPNKQIDHPNKGKQPAKQKEWVDPQTLSNKCYEIVVYFSPVSSDNLSPDSLLLFWYKLQGIYSNSTLRSSKELATGVKFKFASKKWVRFSKLNLNNQRKEQYAHWKVHKTIASYYKHSAQLFLKKHKSFKSKFCSSRFKLDHLQ